jgi:hypothetical protein
MAAKRKALCVGINDYPYNGSDLNGCVNDAHGWAGVLTDHFGFASTDVTLLLDAKATKKAILQSLKALLAGASSGDVLVFANSSHGSYVADKDKDEERYDEILCPYDIDDNHILDDDLRALFSGLPAGVTLTVILDNCFSGTATRAALSDVVPGLRPPDDRRMRFLSPALRGMRVLENPWRARSKTKEKHPQERMKEVLLSGCSDREYSYDALQDGKYHGAMTYAALRALKQANYSLTYRQLHDRIMSLISDYPQTPQLEGSKANIKKQIFA